MKLFGIKWRHSNIKPDVSLTRIHNWVFNGKPWSDWELWLALDTYSILAEAFSWDTYTTLIKQYYNLPSLSSDDTKLDMWARRYSQTVKTNLCPYFEWWGWPLTAATKEACALLPAWSKDPLARFSSKHIYAEVEIPMASDRSLLVDKTLVAINLELITVSSDIDVFYFTFSLK